MVWDCIASLHFLRSGFSFYNIIGACEKIRQSKELWVKLEAQSGLEIIEGQEQQVLEFLEGWGDLQIRSAKNMIYPSLPVRGHRDVVTWIVKGRGRK